MVSVSARRWIVLVARSLSVVLLIGTALLLVDAVTTKPFEIPPLQPNAVPDALPTTAQDLHDLAWYAPLWQRDLRQPLYDDPTPVTEPAPPAPLPELLGTFAEADQTFGHFKTAEGKTFIRSAPGMVGEYKVLIVEAGRARLKNGESTYWVETPKPVVPE